MQAHLQLQGDKRKLFDYCEECQCYHQAFIRNGILVLESCQNQIYDISTQEKILSETNVSSQNNCSLESNSISSISIQNHLSPSNKPNTTPRNSYLKNVTFIKQPLKTPIYVTSKQKNIGYKNITPIKNKHFYDTPTLQYQNHTRFLAKQIPNLKRQLKNHHIKTISQNTIRPQKNNIKQDYMLKHENAQKYENILKQKSFPIRFFDWKNNSNVQTPQFGSQSIISVEKQNILRQKSPIQRNKEQFCYFSENDTQNRIQKTKSQIQQNSDYFCCGYIRKCNE